MSDESPYEYCKCICGKPIKINSYLPFDDSGRLIDSNGIPLYFCEHQLKYRGKEVLLRNGARAIPSDLVHSVCCILLCEKDHFSPCSHRVYEGDGNLRQTILQNQEILLKDIEYIKKLWRDGKNG